MDYMEIYRLLVFPRGTKENKRMFQLYNELTGTRWAACNCSGKVRKITTYLGQLLLDAGYVGPNCKCNNNQ